MAKATVLKRSAKKKPGSKKPTAAKKTSRVAKSTKLAGLPAKPGAKKIAGKVARGAKGSKAAKTSSPKTTAALPIEPHSFMWRLLEKKKAEQLAKDASHKESGHAQDKEHAKFGPQGFARFQGPRRRAA